MLAPLAAAGRRVTAIDMRGQYESPTAVDAGGYRVGELAADVAQIAEAVAGGGTGDRVHLLGHSFGGLVASELMTRQVGRMSSLTLMSSGPGALSGPRAEVLGLVLAQLRPVPPAGLAAEVERIWATMMEPEAVAGGVPAELIAFLRTRLLRSCPLGLRSMAEDLLSCPDRTATLAATRPAPILVVYGENDNAWPPAIQESMARRLGAQRVCVPGAAHSPAVEAPETVASTLTAFWNATETAHP